MKRTAILLAVFFSFIILITGCSKNKNDDVTSVLGNSIIDGYWSSSYNDTKPGHIFQTQKDNNIFQIKTTRIEGYIVYFDGMVVYSDTDEYYSRPVGMKIINDGRLNVSTGKLSYSVHVIFHDVYGKRCFPDGNWYKRTGHIGSKYIGDMSSYCTNIEYDTYGKFEFEWGEDCKLMGVGPITSEYIRRHDYDPETGDLIDAVKSEANPELVKKAEAGDSFAQYNLGIMYRIGHGVKRNLDESARWLQKAAEQGLEEAETLLVQDKHNEQLNKTINNVGSTLLMDDNVKNIFKAFGAIPDH